MVQVLVVQAVQAQVDLAVQVVQVPVVQVAHRVGSKAVALVVQVLVAAQVVQVAAADLLVVQVVRQVALRVVRVAHRVVSQVVQEPVVAVQLQEPLVDQADVHHVVASPSAQSVKNSTTCKHLHSPACVSRAAMVRLFV